MAVSTETNDLDGPRATPVPGTAAPPLPPLSLSMREIRAAVPKHCFERSLLRSVGHLLLDLAMITTMGVSVFYLDDYINSSNIESLKYLKLVLWPLYWWWQGVVMTGVWVLAHECGHQAFSPWKSVNDAFGLVLHSALLVPYHSWRITHGQHHKYTCHTTMDQVFVPCTREEYNEYHNITISEKDNTRRYRSAINEALEETPIGDLINILKMFTLGWPAYLAFNAAGQPYTKGSNHFNPKADMYSDRDYTDIVVSDLGILAVFGLIGYSCYFFGGANVAFYYFVPYLFTNMWLVLYTYLQHSDPAIPHYTPKEFTFVRGALCTIDRDYGVYNWFHHRIGQTHVVHHLFSQMPFYHSEEATEAVKKVLGPMYYRDTTGIVAAIRRSWKYCKFLDPEDGDIMYYRSYHELPEQKKVE